MARSLIIWGMVMVVVTTLLLSPSIATSPPPPPQPTPNVATTTATSTTAASTLTCDICLAVFEVFDIGVRTNMSIDEIEKIAVDVCLKMKIYGGYPDVCQGTVNEFTPELVQIITEAYTAPLHICERLNLCQAPNITVPNRYGEMEVVSPVLLNPGRPTPQKKKVPAANVGTIVHISDLHVDLEYQAGTNALCGKPLCCRNESGPAPNSSAETLPWGMYGDCDAPLVLLQSMIESIAALDPAPDFILWTGDNPPHDIWEQSQEKNLNSSYVVAQALINGLKVPIYGTVGNHESFPVNQFEGPGYDSWLYNALASDWAKWLTPEAFEMVKYGGFYTQLIAPKLRIISVNTQYALNGNFWLLLNETDPGHQLQWMESVLEEAKQNNETVYIIGHCPWGEQGLLAAYGAQVHQMLDKYRDIIQAQFFGHTHHDHFEVVRDVATNTIPIGRIFIAPSLTPYGGTGPSYRVYQYDRTNYDILDFSTYSVNLTLANLNNRADWEKTYSFVEEYQLNALTAGDLQSFVSRMQGDVNLFDRFMTHFYGGFQSPCDQNCEKYILCRAASCTSTLLMQCLNGNNHKPKSLCGDA